METIDMKGMSVLIQALEGLFAGAEALEQAPARLWAWGLAAARADWGPALERAARLTAALMVLVAVIAADLAVLAVRLTVATHRAVLELSDRLAAWWAPLVAGAETVQTVQEPETVQTVQPLVAAPSGQAAAIEQIRRLREQGLGQRTIAKRLGVTRHAVRVALATTVRA